MLSPSVIETRRGSAHCPNVAATARLALLRTSAADRYVSSGEAQPAIQNAFLPHLEDAARVVLGRAA